VQYPVEWRIEKWNRKELGSPPTPVKLSVRDPVQCIAQQLVNPELMLGYSNEHRHFRPYMKTNINGDRIYSDLQSSRWAEETATLIGPDEILIPLILYDDEVNLNKVGNSSCNPAQGTLGIFSDEILRKPISKMCFGYIPSLEECFDRGLILKHLVSIGYQKSPADDMIKLFYKRIRAAFWDLVLQPINAVKDGVDLYVLGNSRYNIYSTFLYGLFWCRQR
jgi:hypothetical protein